MNDSSIKYKGQYITVKEEMRDNAIFEQAFFLPTVHVFPITKDGKILFIEEQRWDTNETRLLLPSGVLDVDGEKLAHCAKRELEEEIAYSTDRHLELVYTYAEKGTINSERSYFIARDLYKLDKQVEPQIKNIIEIDTLELMAFIKSGKFGSSKSVLAYLDLIHKVDQGIISL